MASKVAQASGEDILVEERLGRRIALENGEGATPIFEHAKGPNQFPHYHTAFRTGGHIFVRSLAAGLTASYYLHGRGAFAEGLGTAVDFVSPFSLPQDLFNLYDFFVPAPDDGFVAGTLYEGISVTANAPPLSSISLDQLIAAGGFADARLATYSCTPAYNVVTYWSARW